MTFEDSRASLLDALDAAGSPEEIFEFQVRIADGIRAAEPQKTDEAHQHRHLLRLMGDALAWKLVDRHTIREMARSRRDPPSISSQGEDFDFVMSVARRGLDGGIPVICDLTHLLAVGDIVSVGHASVSVLECKNKKFPLREPSGRHARQEARARRASDYLSRGHVTGSDGRTTVSVDLDEPPSAYGVLRDCVDRAYAGPDGGSSVGVIGERDFILVLRHGSKTVGELMEPLMETVRPDGWRLPVLQGFSGAIWHPSPFRGNPYTLPLSAAQRTDLAEGDMTVMRIVDAGALDYAGDPRGVSVRIEVHRRGEALCFETLVNGRSVELSDRFIDQVLWDFKPLAGTRAMVAEAAALFGHVDDGSQTPPFAAASPAVNTMSGFAYRTGDDDQEPVVTVRLGQLKDVGVDISALEGLPEDPDDRAQGMTAFPVVMECQDGRLAVRLVEPGGTD
ncbi:hypothetical protein [Kitasatospora sp. NPDC056273]|uniref:hypothetical protein n=1 Tax=Kitasatospora sp. NPDC056273 TaxID=3345769 RepID=UPI0035DB98DF